LAEPILFLAGMLPRYAPKRVAATH
jgi:hypothetical protein